MSSLTPEGACEAGPSMEEDRAIIEPGRWVERHGDYLFRFAMVRVRHAELAADLVQEAFLEGLRAAGTFTGRSSERTWLAAILKHKIIDRRRRSIREATYLDGLAEAAAPPDFDRRGRWAKPPGDWPDDPATAFDRREFWEALHRCLSAMPAALAEPFILRELDGMNGDEICKLLEITPTNLWVRLHRARLALRRCLESRRPDVDADPAGEERTTGHAG